jgi:hypothetical protein
MTVLPGEVQQYLHANLVEQYAQQRELGRVPSNLLVDGRAAPLGLASIAQAKRRGQLIYGDTAQVLAAARYALAELERLTPVASGAGRASFRVFINGVDIGGPEALTDQLADRLKQTDVLRIVGPTVKYGRRLAYRSGRTKTLNLRAGRSTRIRVRGVTRAAPDVVASAVARRFPGVYTSDPWITTRFFAGIGPDARTPSVSIGLKRRGKLY